jgi:hypothetical protein
VLFIEGSAGVYDVAVAGIDDLLRKQQTLGWHAVRCVKVIRAEAAGPFFEIEDGAGVPFTIGGKEC